MTVHAGDVLLRLADADGCDTTQSDLYGGRDMNGPSNPDRELFAVALVGEETTAGGWLVTARGADEAVSIVHGTDPRAHECSRGELMVWTAEYFRTRHLGGGDFPDTWIVLDEAGP